MRTIRFHHTTIDLSRHNIMVSPIVLGIRLPIMLVLLVIVWAGEGAEWLGDHIPLPGFR